MGSIRSEVTCLGCGFVLWSGSVGEATNCCISLTYIFLSPSLSPSFPLTLKSISMSLGENLKKKQNWKLEENICQRDCRPRRCPKLALGSSVHIDHTDDHGEAESPPRSGSKAPGTSGRCLWFLEALGGNPKCTSGNSRAQWQRHKNTSSLGVWETF